MSNNRNSNRRRGRGNNRSQGGNQLNRIDSRARGNAPQLLEKYKKLAHDAALNGDRVQAEYYLQFADHYFRVIADSRAQKDEQRGGQRRDFERERPEDEDYFEDEFDRAPRHDGGRREEPVAEEAGEDAAEEGRRGSEGPEFEAEEFEPADNPFTRASRGKPRRNRRERAAEPADEDDDNTGNRLDPSALPAAIGREERDDEAPQRRPRRTRSRSSDDDEELEAVG